MTIKDEQYYVDPFSDPRIYSYSPVIVLTWEDITHGPPVLVTQNIDQFGYEYAEFINGTIEYTSIVHKNDRSLVLACRKNISGETGGHYEQTYRLHKKNNDIVSVHDYTIAITNAHNRRWYYSYIMDISKGHTLNEEHYKQEFENRLKILAKFPEENPNPVLRAAKDGSVLYSNKSSKKLLAIWSAQESRSLPGYLQNAIIKVLEENKPTEIETEIDKRTYLFSVTPVVDVMETYIYGIDISEKRKTEKKLQLTSKIFETTIEGIFVTDPDGAIQSVNPAFSVITGYSSDEVIGKNPRILKSERHEAHFYATLWKDLLEKGKWSGEIWNRRKNGETYPQWTSISAIKDDAGNIENHVAVFTDITNTKIKEAEIEYRAFHDPLTGLPNRNLMDDRLEQAINHAKRSGKKLGLMFMDLDRFKIINDSLGHIIGDYLLQHVAKRLIGSIRDDDTVSRIGGDEFVVLLPEITDISVISIVAERILEAFKPPFLLKEHELFVVPSIGIAIFPDDGKDQIELFKFADLAMYDSKKSGGNRYHFYSDDLEKTVKKKLTMENKIRHAFKKNQFQLYYQPIIDLAKNTITGAEALIRWYDPELGFVKPDEFIPLAEEIGFIIDINDWVIQKAATDNKKLHDAGFPSIYFSVNITSHHFFQGRILTAMDTLFNTIKLPPENLVLEITENSLMDNAEEIIALMQKLKKLGIRFSIDDFGTGYSSLSYLKKFPLDNLKIDKSFVFDIFTDQESMAIVKTIMALSTSLGIKIIAEGVETAEQLQFFKDNACDFVQGFYYSKPLPLDEFIAFIKKHYENLAV